MWVQGNKYTGTNQNGVFTQGNITPPNKPSSILDSAGRIFGKTHPQYANFAVGQFVSARSQGARGDGQTDDTAAIKRMIDQVAERKLVNCSCLMSRFLQFAGCRILFFDHGTYLVSSTITIPAGTRIVGEAWSVIMGSGAAFSDVNNPQPVVRVGTQGSQGVLEITDMLFTTRGPGTQNFDMCDIDL